MEATIHRAIFQLPLKGLMTLLALNFWLLSFFFFISMDDKIFCQYLKHEIKRGKKQQQKVDKILEPEPILPTKYRILQLRAPVFVPLSKYLAYSCACSFTPVIYTICLHVSVNVYYLCLYRVTFIYAVFYGI